MSILPILLTLADIPARQARFLKVLLPLWQAIPGRVNAARFSRYSGWSERTLRRWFSKALPWHRLHFGLLRLLIQSCALGRQLALVMDATFVAKSGRHTFGRGDFWNSCNGRAEKGLELSCIALMDVAGGHVFPLSLRQTRPKDEKADRLTQYRSQLAALFRLHRSWLKTHVQAVVADGQYAKRMFFDAVSDEGLTFVTKLARNANLMMPFTGVHPKRRGGRQKWERKVDFVNFDGWTPVASDRNERIWTHVVWAPHFQRQLRVVVVQRLGSGGKVITHAVLCSTDTNMPAETVLALYSARFQLEFVFRDAKQHAALTTCQMRSKKGLENHWNAAFMSISLARAEQMLQESARTGRPAEAHVFSMEDVRRRAFNVLFAQRILANLGLSERFADLKEHPSRPLDFGTRAA